MASAEGSSSHCEVTWPATGWNSYPVSKQLGNLEASELTDRINLGNLHDRLDASKCQTAIGSRHLVHVSRMQVAGRRLARFLDSRRGKATNMLNILPKFASTTSTSILSKLSGLAVNFLRNAKIYLSLLECLADTFLVVFDCCNIIPRLGSHT